MGRGSLASSRTLKGRTRAPGRTPHALCRSCRGESPHRAAQEDRRSMGFSYPSRAWSKADEEAMSARPLSDIGAAVVGTGFIGAVHVEALRRLGVQVYGVVGSSHARAAERAAALGLPSAYESFEAMVADPRVDVVHITSPNHMHYPQAVAA